MQIVLRKIRRRPHHLQLAEGSSLQPGPGQQKSLVGDNNWLFTNLGKITLKALICF
jgi:hypothetical protein